MRIVALVVLGTLVACSGQVEPDGTDRAASRQNADEPRQEQEWDQSERFVTMDTTGTSGTSGTSGRSGTSSAPGGEPTCFDYGAPADGECTVGEWQFCDGFRGTALSTSSSSSGSAVGAPYCQQVCVNDRGKAVWSEKFRSDCAHFDSKWHRDIEGCSCSDWKARQPPANTPLVLSFDDAPVTFTSNAGGAFDLVADGACHGTDWPSAATPWLALDRNANGSIDDGSELFGSAVVLADGTRAKNGFIALRELDSNRDGVFDASDEAFAKVVVWTDRNGDRRSTPNELTSLSDAGVRSISLAAHRDLRCDARGNCEGERSTFTMTTGRRGTVIDVYLKTR